MYEVYLAYVRVLSTSCHALLLYYAGGAPHHSGTLLYLMVGLQSVVSHSLVYLSELSVDCYIDTTSSRSYSCCHLQTMCTQ